VALVLSGGAAAGPHLALGVVAAAVSSGGYSLFTVCSARLIRQGHCSTSVMGVVFSGTAVCLSPMLLLFPIGWILTARGCAVVAFLGLIATSGAYCLYGYGLRHTPSSAAAVLVLAEPATAALLAVAVLGEHLGWIGGAGLAVVFAALVLTAAPTRAGRQAPAVGPRHVRGSRPDADHRPHSVLASSVVVASVRFPLEVWRRLELEAEARGLEPDLLITSAVDLALSSSHI
jgi:threonine/homoserine efflux transporter RhtA